MFYKGNNTRDRSVKLFLRLHKNQCVQSRKLASKYNWFGMNTWSWVNDRLSGECRGTGITKNVNYNSDQQDLTLHICSCKLQLFSNANRYGKFWGEFSKLVRGNRYNYFPGSISTPTKKLTEQILILLTFGPVNCNYVSSNDDFHKNENYVPVESCGALGQFVWVYDVSSMTLGW